MSKTIKFRPLKKRGLFYRDRSGATVIEFAMLALPFFLTLFAILEVTITYTAQQVLSNATDKVARQIRTGQIDPAAITAADFKKKVCDNLVVLIPTTCPGLTVDVRNYSSFPSVPKNLFLFSESGVDSGNAKFDPGGPLTINQMQVYYEWPIVLNVFAKYMANIDDDKLLLFSTLTWRNEP